jgi:hypothetical protein
MVGALDGKSRPVAHPGFVRAAVTTFQGFSETAGPCVIVLELSPSVVTTKHRNGESVVNSMEVGNLWISP